MNGTNPDQRIEGTASRRNAPAQTTANRPESLEHPPTDVTRRGTQISTEVSDELTKRWIRDLDNAFTNFDVESNTRTHTNTHKLVLMVYV